MSTPNLPHFTTPFVFDNKGKPVVDEQDSPEDIGSCILNIVSCPQGALFYDPQFGVPPMLFDVMPLDLTSVLIAVAQYEPRAELTALQNIEATLQNAPPGTANIELLVQAITQGFNTGGVQ